MASYPSRPQFLLVHKRTIEFSIEIGNVCEDTSQDDFHLGLNQ
jgi:hypothetical protein